MKKFLIILFTCILFIPVFVKAEEPVLVDIYVEIGELELGGNLPGTVQLLSEFVEDGEVSITWYVSNEYDGAYVSVTSPVIEYNKYYRFDITDEIKIREGYECNNYIFNGKSYSSPNKFVINPFRKYFVDVNLEGLDYEGPDEIVDGEDFVGKLIPKRGYRLPEYDELIQYNLIVEIDGNKLELDSIYNHNSGEIRIDDSMIYGDIMITAIGRDVALFEFTSGANQKYVFGSGKPLEFVMDADISLFDNNGVLYINGMEVDSSAYTVEEGSTKFIFKEELINTLKVGEYTLKADFYDGQAETTFSVINKEEVNPNTSDNIFSYIILGIISVVTIIGSYLYLKRKRTN